MLIMHQHAFVACMSDCTLIFYRGSARELSQTLQQKRLCWRACRYIELICHTLTCGINAYCNKPIRGSHPHSADRFSSPRDDKHMKSVKAYYAGDLYSSVATHLACYILLLDQNVYVAAIIRCHGDKQLQNIMLTPQTNATKPVHLLQTPLLKSTYPIQMQGVILWIFN